MMQNVRFEQSSWPNGVQHIHARPSLAALQDCAHTGRIILTKSSSVSVSDQDHTQFTLEHVR